METVQNEMSSMRPVSSAGQATLVRKRVEQLRESHLQLKYDSASIDRLRIETRVMSQTEGEPMVLRRAKVFAALVRERPTVILPDELIVGHAGVKHLCQDLIPDDLPVLLAGKPISPIQEQVTYALKDLYPEDQRALQEEIAPYWRGDGDWARTQIGSNLRALPAHLRELLLTDDTVFPPSAP